MTRLFRSCLSFAMMLWLICLSSQNKILAQSQGEIAALFAQSASLNDTQKIVSIFHISDSLQTVNPILGLALLEALQKKDFYKKAKYHPEMIFLHRGILHKNNGNYAAAIQDLEAFYTISKEKNIFQDMAAAKYKLADIYIEEKRTELAIESNLEAIALYEKIKDDAMIISSKIQMVAIYKHKERFKESLAILQEIVQKIPFESPQRLGVYNQLANVYDQLGELDSAIVYNKMYFETAKKFKDLPGQFIAKYNEGLNHFNLERYDLAKNNFLEALTIAEASNIPLFKPYAMISLIDANVRLGKTNEGLSLLQEASGLALNREQRKMLAEVSYKLHKEQGNYKLALDFMESYKMLEDSLEQENNIAKINDLQLKYETTKKQDEIDRLALVSDLKNKQVRAQKIGLWFLAGILAVLGYLLYKNIQQKSEIKVQNQTIQKSLEDKDILLREIHHRVKNNLQVVSSLLNLQSSYISDKIALEAINEGKNRVSSMALIHQNLYTEKNLTEIETKRYFEELLDQLFDSYNIDSDSISLEKDIDSVLLDVDMMIPLGLITNELISNALKHAFINRKTGTVFFKLKKMEEKLLITISDNGSGMSAKQFLESDSFGNKLIHAFVQKLKGSMDIESNNGTQITLNLNIKTPAA